MLVVLSVAGFCHHGADMQGFPEAGAGTGDRM
jgi:hypothetical protein